MAKLVINSGPNLSPELVTHYGLEVLPIRLIVDGEEHEIADVEQADVDRWIQSAKEFPYLLSTSAAECAAGFLRAGERSSELLALMTSRKLMQSYDAAKAAIRTLEHHAKGRSMSVTLVDTGSTDVAAGLSVIYAAEALAAGHSVQEAAQWTEAFASHTTSVFALRTLENITKGGRASFLKSWLANLLKVRPLLSFVDGEIASVGRYSANEDPVEALLRWLAENLGFDERRPVWVAVGHGGCLDDAERLLERLHGVFDVRYGLVRPLVPSVYLHGGAGSLIATVVPLDVLPWFPSRPQLR